ncbi:hypothetical protein [Mitsuokella sp.]
MALLMVVWIASCLFCGGLFFFLACLAEEWNAKERQAWHDQHEDD